MADLTFAQPEGFSPEERGLLQYHRDHLTSGTYLDKNGDITSVYITGVQGPDGREYNIPGYWNGQIMKPDEAAQMAAQAGWKNFPSYKTPEEADAAAERLHKLIEQDTTAFRKWRGGGQ